MSTPRSVYEEAARRVRCAAEACVHWDYETRHEGGDHECCHEYAEALEARAKARKALRAAEAA